MSTWVLNVFYYWNILIWLRNIDYFLSYFFSPPFHKEVTPIWDGMLCLVIGLSQLPNLKVLCICNKTFLTEVYFRAGHLLLFPSLPSWHLSLPGPKSGDANWVLYQSVVSKERTNWSCLYHLLIIYIVLSLSLSLSRDWLIYLFQGIDTWFWKLTSPESSG